MNYTELPDPLPENEYNFSIYKDEFSITEAFHYEYCRSIVELHEWILPYRRYYGSPIPPAEEYSKKLDIKAYFEYIKRFPIYEFFPLLSALEGFPTRPLSECTEDLKTKRMFYTVHTSPRGLYCWDKSMIENKHDFDALTPVSNYCYTSPSLNSQGFGLKYLTFLQINWGCTDKELIEEFSEFLKTTRPDKFKDMKQPMQRGLGNIVLPFKKDSALDYLSVWRRKEYAQITWDQYIALYHPEYDNPKNTLHYKRRDFLRNLQKQNSNAKKIIKWFCGDTSVF